MLIGIPPSRRKAVLAGRNVEGVIPRHSAVNFPLTMRGISPTFLCSSGRLTLRLVPLLVLVMGLAAAEAPPTRHDATSHHSFADVEHWVAVFDDPARDAWQKPADVVRALEIGRG